MTINPEIELTEDGTQTLRHPVLGDFYHSTRGAVGEAMHIFIANGLQMSTHSEQPLRIMEVGFGSGLNAWLTMIEANKSNTTVEYTTIELYPVDNQTISQLKYAQDPLFCKLHNTPWGTHERISPLFTIKKIEANLVDTIFDTTFDLIYFDAFAPDTQPQMWSDTVFERLYANLSFGGALVTYSAKGEVKRAMRNAGFTVHRLQGALGKRHMIRAIKEV